MDKNELIKVVDAAKSGDNSAFETLYTNYYGYVKYSLLKKHHDVSADVIDDAVQTAFVKAFEKLKDLADSSSFKTWIHTIAENCLKDELGKAYYRRETSISETEDEDGNDISDRFETLDESTLPEITLDNKETSRLVEEILSKLPDMQRFAIVSYYFDEMSVKEIASLQDVSENTIKSRLNQGRKKIEAEVIELEKKGTKLYSVAPFMFFLLLFKTDAKACELSAMGTRVSAAIKAASVKNSGSAVASASKGFGAKAIAAKFAASSIGVKIAAGVAAVAVIGGVIGGVAANRNGLDNKRKYDCFYIDLYDNGEVNFFRNDEDSDGIYSVMFKSADVEEERYMSLLNSETREIYEEPSIYAKVFNGNVYILVDIEGNEDPLWNMAGFCGIEDHDYTTEILIEEQLEETNYDYSSWIRLNDFYEYTTKRDAYKSYEKNNAARIAQIWATAETLEEEIEDEDITENEKIEESSAAEDDGIEAIDENKDATAGAYSSETSYVQSDGLFASESGDTLFISMFSGEDSGSWKGNIEGTYVNGAFNGTHNNGALSLVEERVNVYRLKDCDYNNNFSLTDTSLEIAVDNGGNTVRLYDNGNLIEVFERDMSFDPNSVG